MALAGHLREFKRRFYIAGAAFIVCAIGGFFLAEPVLHVLRAPLDELRAQGLTVELNVTNITQGFDLQMRIGFMLGLIISSPIWLWQLLAFIVPGLIMLTLLSESTSNASFGIYMPRFTGAIYELLSAPVGVLETLIGFVGAAAMNCGCAGSARP